MALGPTEAPGTHQARWRRAGGRGRAPDSKEGRAKKSRRGRERWEGKRVKQKVRLRPQRGPRGLEVLGPPGWNHRGPSQSPPPSHGPSGAAEGLPVGPAPRVQAPSCLPVPGLSETACKTEGPAGPEVRGWTLGLKGMWGPGGHSVTPEPALGPTDGQTDRQTGWGCQVASCSPAAWELCRVALCLPLLPAPLPAPHQVPGVGGSDVRPT